MLNQAEPLTYRKIFFFWLPLAATWLMMAAEGPFLAAIIARLAEPKFNLAAYGVAFSFAVLIEAPIIMIMSAATALVHDRDSFLKLRNYTYMLNAVITGIMLIFLIPPVFDLVAEGVIGLPPHVAHLTYLACWLMLPWPAVIGYRRFFQGILIRSNLTRRVAYGTVVRLSTMGITALIISTKTALPGAAVGGLSLSVGVTLEAAASRLMARGAVRNLRETEPDHTVRPPLTYRSITRFYTPLALTSILGLGVHPMTTFFLGHSRMALESLAVMPVVNSLVFIFRSIGLSYQEVGIALMGERGENFRRLRNFAAGLGIVISAGLALVAFTPLSFLWFRGFSGLSLELSLFAGPPARILALMPALTVLISFQRAILVVKDRTTPITIATAIEVAGIAGVLLLTLQVFGATGAVGAAAALLTGRVFSNLYLVAPSIRAMGKV